MRYNRALRLTLVALFASVGSTTCLAQKAPELGYLYPPAIRIGEVAAVQLGGYDLTPDLQFFVHDPRLTLQTRGELSDFFVPEPPYWFGEKGMMPASPMPREVSAQIEVPGNVSPGIYRWQVANASGASASSSFYLSDIDETREDRFREETQLLATLPIGVSGRLSKIAEVDDYEFTARQSGLVTVELLARRLGSDFHGVIEIRDVQETLVTHAADTLGNDLAVAFDATMGERYRIRLHDIDFRGHRSFVYRLSVTPGPRLQATIPAAVNPEGTVDVTFVGMGLTSGTAKLETLTETVSVPPPTAKEKHFRYELATAHGTLSRQIPISDVPIHRLPSAAGSEPATLPVPCAVTSVMNASGEASFQFAATKGETLHLSAVSRAIGSDLDLELVIRDASGKQLAAADDLPGTQDAGLDFKVRSDSVFTCLVRDLSGRTYDAASIFRVAIERPASAFSLNMPQHFTVPLGGQTTIAVNAGREGGFTGEIEIEAKGLPNGVTIAEDAKIPAGKNALKLVITAAADAEVVARRIQIVGRAVIDEATVSVTAVSEAAGNLCPTDPADQEVDFALLAVTMKPPFAVEVTDKNRQRAVNRGTTYPAPLIVKRDQGFADVVTLQMASRQGRRRQGIRGGIVDVPGGVEIVQYPCFMPEWLATDRTSRMVVHGVGRVADPQGRPRFIMTPANARITMILEGALLKLTHSAPELSVALGQSFEIPVEVSRSAKLQTDVSIELIVPPEIAGLVEANELTLPADESAGKLLISTRPDDLLAGRWTLLLKATTWERGKWPVVSQSEVEVEFRDD